ncbi:AraC family transcriptional regulator [Streptomyces inusitatus]|uniref:AraC family transcriptional regulator n=1 Tax=Streptomyces inusitatus TaxID=68221 RepID=A0A918V0G7_9ACTN|nr:AraC family transcriptional regulator [Streptomyces inusitatus]GGZ48922.1 AraC family transcriptional regulator [Streptomyces inusitatus]
MESTIERVVTRVIEDMRANLGERITIDDMAQTAMFSKFHFTRLFRGQTGVSPGRFLSALRLNEAKRLLINTDLSIADISNCVGYSSVGTFSSRFKTCVGIAPSTYRQFNGFVSEIPTADDNLPQGAAQTSITGTVSAAPEGDTGFVFIGLFPDCIPQGQPVRCVILDRPGPYTLRNVPPGTWHVLVQSVPYGMEESQDLGEDDATFVGAHGPVTVGPDETPAPADIELRPIRALDPPVLLALLDMRLTALRAVAA